MKNQALQDPVLISKRTAAVVSSVITILSSLGILESIGLTEADVNNTLTAISGAAAAIFATWSKVSDTRPKATMEEVKKESRFFKSEERGE